ncbi:MAG TPA: glycosyltransferase [Bryobacteraceae bacterium]|jgi:tetratricopeptide (TPR) repeat protein|nr:glycosyltransferase [Bryobacteraceae bacterium]
MTQSRFADRTVPQAHKPKLLFFQYCYDESLPSFLLNHKREHVECLAQFFVVTLVTEDCDYGQMCESHQPDLVLFESGVPFATCRRPEIRNVRAHGQIPKLGLMHSDAFCEARAGFLSDMERWGVETFFAIATTAAEYTQALRPNLFVWPNFVDPETYRDYGEAKNIPVLFTGSTGTLYPWRKGILRRVSARYPSLICPHPGYSPKAQLQAITGERYARLLNASNFVPACGTVAKELVRKHLEIPACRSCLITEDSPALRAAGFEDGINCVFATESDVVDKLADLFGHPEKLASIVDAGYKLIHSRHTMRQRDQVRQWLDLRRQLKPGEKIIQPGPFERLQIVSVSSPSPYFASNGLHLDLLRQGDSALVHGRYEEAERAYAQCLHYYRFMPEPQLRLALCRLLQGDSAQALAWIQKPLRYLLTEYRSPDPDPVEWAYFLIALLCAGRLEEARARSDEFAGLKHPELDRARALTAFLGGYTSPITDESGAFRPSIHRLPVRSWDDWKENVGRMLKACGQGRFENALASWKRGEAPAPTLATGPRGRFPSSRSVFERQRARSKRREQARRTIANFLHSLESRFGYFLPYAVSGRKKHPFFAALESVLGEQQVDRVLAVGSAKGTAIGALQRVPSNIRIVRTEALVAGNALCPQDTDFDLVLIDASGRRSERFSSDVFESLLPKARLLFLYGISRASIRAAYFTLIDHPGYVLLDQQLKGPDAYAIFEAVPRDSLDQPEYLNDERRILEVE